MASFGLALSTERGFEGVAGTGFADTARVAYDLGQAGADDGGEGVAH